MEEGKLNLESKDIAEEKRQELLCLFPEAVTEGGKIDFDQLKRALGETVDAGRERYGMNWPGKADCFRLIQSPSTATLLPVREESVRFDETENLIIEGDNLEVLKLLQKGYQGKVKMIYIDPPYNTGNDFIYPDDFADNLKNYLQYTGQVDAEGKPFSNNVETDGRFHSNWLNMMYPRLYLARNLLQNDGVIFISIDDSEIVSLRALCDQLFGESCFIANIVWRRTVSAAVSGKSVVVAHDHVLVYGRTPGVVFSKMPVTDVKKYKYPDRDVRGSYKLQKLERTLEGARPTMTFEIATPVGPIVKTWAVSKEKFHSLLKDNRIAFSKKGQPYYKQFLAEYSGRSVDTWWDDAGGYNQEASIELKRLFGGDAIFETPKPTELVQLMSQLALSRDGVVLDFFAGAGVTASAAAALNNADGGNRKFILVQLPEPTGRNDYKTIADITKERVRRVIAAQEKQAAGNLDFQHEGKLNRKEGFRVFKLAPSNFKIWDAHTKEGVQGVERQMELSVNHILPERTAEDLFYELLLKSEYPLTAKVETFDAAGILAYSVESDALIVCVERKVTADAVAAISRRKPSKVIFLDEAFSGNDQLKANARMNFESAGVKRFETV